MTNQIVSELDTGDLDRAVLALDDISALSETLLPAAEGTRWYSILCIIMDVAQRGHD